MVMIRIRKDEEGGASGHDDGTGKPWSFEWPEAGAVLEVPYAVAVELLRNPEWGYSEAGDAGSEDTKDDEETVEEPTPTDGQFSESPTPRKASGRAAKKSAAPPAPPAKE